MNRLNKSLRPYLVSYSVILVVSLMLQLIYSQQEIFLFINQNHSLFFDFLFRWGTYLGDGVFFSVVIFLLLFLSYRNALLGLITFLSTSLVAQLLKRFVFDDHSRPYAVLKDAHDLIIPDGITPLFNNSFPSGHTTTAFALSTFLLLILSGKVHWSILLFLACLVGFSRIYLTHHFPVDVWAGSLIGVAGSVLLFWWLSAIFDKKFGNRSILNR